MDRSLKNSINEAFAELKFKNSSAKLWFNETFPKLFEAEIDILANKTRLLLEETYRGYQRLSVENKRLKIKIATLEKELNKTKEQK